MSTVASKNHPDYFAEVVAVTEEYLGPAAERFVRRQIDFHLNKKPEDVTFDDIAKLTDSVRIALGLLVNDKDIVNHAAADLQAIQR